MTPPTDDESSDPEHRIGSERRPSRSSTGGRHLWQINAVRDLVLLGLLVLFFLVLVRIQGAVVPVLVAFVLAYVLEPAIAFLERKWSWRRGIIVAGFMLLILGLTVAFTALLAPNLVKQLVQLSRRLPRYIELLNQKLGIELPQIEEVVRKLASAQPRELATIAQSLFGEAGKLIGTITGVLGTTVSILTAIALTVILFAFFALRFPRIPSIKQFLPASHRDELWHRLQQVESIFAGFFRGQLIVALWTTTAFSIGFAISGVPFWFVAALLGGLFSIIPYGQGIGWLLAVLFGLFEMQTAGTDIGWTAVLLGPTIVYVLMQSLETMVVTPLVQGSSTRLHPVAVLVAIIAGGGLGGIVGVFFAIPIAATLRVFVLEVGIPRLRAWADEN